MSGAFCYDRRRMPGVWVARVVVAIAASATVARGAPVDSLTRTPEKAVPAESITALYQDRAGFVWVGTREGLARYDGYSAVVYEHDTSDPGSLADNSTRTIFEDREGRLWVGTNSGGLDRLDRATGKFAHLRHDAGDPSTLSHDSVFDIVQDRDGKLWVGTQSGLDRVDPSTSRVERFPAGPNGPGGNFVTGLHLDTTGALWIATVGGGLSRRDPVTGAFTTFRHDPKVEDSIPDDEVFIVRDHGDGGLWLSTWGGVCWFDPATGRATRYLYPGVPAGAAQATTMTARGADGSIFAGSYDKGVWRLAPGASGFVRQPLGAAGIRRDDARVVSLLSDSEGALWIGTWGDGLGRISARALEVASTSTAHAAAESPDADVVSVYEDPGGVVWTGGYEGAISRLDPSGRRTSVSSDGVALAFRPTPDGTLWIGGNSGLHRFDPRTDKALPANGPAPDRGGLGPGWVWTILVDHRGRLWVGTGEAGLHRRREDGSFDRFRQVPGDPSSLSDDYVMSLLEDRSGTLWVGTRSGGLNAFDERTGTFTRYLPDRGDETSLAHQTVMALLEDRHGTLWVGTGGGGLQRVDRIEGSPRVRFTRFTEKDGLIDDNVVGMLEDDDGTLWLATRRGLSRFDPRSQRFSNLGIEDGLPSAEFAVGAVWKGRSKLYFGTHRGLVTIPRGTPFLAPQPSPVRLTSIRTPRGAWTGDRPAWETESIEFPYGETISFEFASLDYGDRRRHRYAYQLAGVHRDWVDLGTHRELTLTALDPGRYTLHVRGRNDQGVWSEIPHPILLRVVPPFWKTSWFRFSIGAAVLSLLAGGHLLRTTSLERRNRELALLKDQRERALDDARASQTALHEAYDRLRGLTRRLEAAKEEERKHIARELHDEMGQILTAAKLNLQVLKRKLPPGGIEPGIGDTIGLIDRMIGQVRALSLDLRPPLLDEFGLGPALRGYLDAQAKRSGVVFAIDLDGTPPGLSADNEIAAFRIVQEAVTNVLRHAEARRVAVTLRHDPGGLDLEIADDGQGFDPASAGLGLLGMRERITSMGGDIRIESSPGRGTVVRARLPLAG